VAPEIGVNLRRILLLALVVAGLGAYLWFYEVPQAEKEGKKEKLLAVDKDAVTGLTLTYPDREIALAKGDQGWRLTKPVDAAADDASVKALVTSLTDAEVQKSLDQVPSDLAPFGLSPPSVTAKVTTKAGERPAIAVGKNTAIGGKTYVRRGDEPKVFLTSSSLQVGLNKQAKDLRDKQILAYQDDDVTKVEITPQNGLTTTLTRKDKDAWTVDPGDHPADVTEVRSYLSSLRSTRAVDFPDDTSKAGLESPRFTVAVTTKAGVQTLLLGAELTQGQQKQVYAKRVDQPTVYTVGDWAFRTLGKDAAAFRDKTVLGFDPSRVGKLVLERKDGPGVTFVRDDKGGWQVEGAEAGKSKATAIARYLDDLKDLRGSGIVAEPPGDLARFGLDAPDLRIVLTDKEGQAIGSILLAKHAGTYYAVRADGPTVFETRDYMYTRLDKQRRDFEETALVPGASTTTIAPSAPPADGAGDDGGVDGDGED
jgi:hypothetical protein